MKLFRVTAIRRLNAGARKHVGAVYIVMAADVAEAKAKVRAEEPDAVHIGRAMELEGPVVWTHHMFDRHEVDVLLGANHGAGVRS